MKFKLIFVVGVLITSMVATADGTFSQRVASEMVVILGSREVRPLLSGGGSFGNLQSIENISSDKDSSIYKLSFLTASAPKPQTRSVFIQICVDTKEIKELDSVSCQPGETL